MPVCFFKKNDYLCSCYREDTFLKQSDYASASDSLIKSLSLEAGIPSSVSTFWVETNGIQVLFDAGYGGTAGHLLAGLDSIGIAPEDVKYVYLTHFHHDHIEGMLNGDSAVFANAEVYASKAEYDGSNTTVGWRWMPIRKPKWRNWRRHTRIVCISLSSVIRFRVKWLP